MITIQILSTRRTLVITGVGVGRYTVCGMTEEGGADWSETGSLSDFIQTSGVVSSSRY